MLIVALVAGVGICTSVSYRIMDTDFWQHLLVGKAIWTLHRVPLEHLWSWPNYGTSEVSWLGRSGWSPSWLFRALIWPVYAAAGVPGLFGWRWITTLLALGFAWAAARRMGATGLTPLVIAVWTSLLYRHRSQIRPETLAALLMAIEIWLLERRRTMRARSHASPGAAPAAAAKRERDLSWALVAVAWIWANAHISYFLFFFLLGLHLLDEAKRARAWPRELSLIFAASAAACFVNPYGWQVLAQPFVYFLKLRNDPMLSGIGELRPLGWPNHRTDGVFVMLVLWPLLLLWRWRKHGFDLVEVGACAFFTWYMAQSERFFGNYALAAAVYLGRDLDGWVRARRWPAWTVAPAARAALAVLAIVAIGRAEWARADRPLGIGIDYRRVPVQAMDFIESHNVRGHSFGQLRVSGYQLWRFWPDRDRLPFMDIHATASAEDRAAYAQALSRRDGWPILDRGGRFDYVVLDPWAADSLLEALDADSTMALVFLDDTGVLYVRRTGVNAAVADSFGYRFIGGGTLRPARAIAAVASAGDSVTRRALIGELARLVASSPGNARAYNMVATLALAEKRYDDARSAFRAALRASPRTPLAHFRLASLALMRNDPQEALVEYGRERTIEERPGIDFGMGLAYKLSGNSPAARRAFEREIARWPMTPSAEAAQRAMSDLK
jgi:hypothetical protein